MHHSVSQIESMRVRWIEEGPDDLLSGESSENSVQKKCQTNKKHTWTRLFCLNRFPSAYLRDTALHALENHSTSVFQNVVKKQWFCQNVVKVRDRQ